MNNKRKKIVSFTDLIVWREGHQLVLLVYEVTSKFPKKETYSLIDQMRRSSASVTNNIAEGFGRKSYKEKTQFYYLSQGSLTELKNQLLIARDVGYLCKKDFSALADQANKTHKLLQGFIRKTKELLNLKS
ncbi:four helix bundle protein [Patescibacteria group bacterium]|nr:four helix bundle protein [Patescibacteria group bacterium]